MARGSITPRPTKDGKIRYRIKWESRDPTTGKRRYYSSTKPNKKAADEFLADKLKEVNDGTFVVASKETLASYLDRWFATARGRWSEATIANYRSIIKRLKPLLGEVRLDRLDDIAIQQAYTKLTTDGYAPNTILGTHRVLDQALDRAVERRVLSRNPTVGVTLPTATSATPEVWTDEEAARFLEKTDDDRFGPLWRLGLDSGMRMGEMLSLAWRDVDFKTGVISVRRTLTRAEESGWKIGEMPKTASSRRAIPVCQATVAALRKHRLRQTEHRLACGDAWTDLDLVFTRDNGRWIDPAVVREAFDRAIKRAGVPAITPHGMRHTMATLLLAAGVHPKIVQERLGHKSIQMTLDRYSHVTMTMQEDAVRALDRLLGNRSRPKRGHKAG
jgi:integrase